MGVCFSWGVFRLRSRMPKLRITSWSRPLTPHAHETAYRIGWERLNSVWKVAAVFASRSMPTATVSFASAKKACGMCRVQARFCREVGSSTLCAGAAGALYKLQWHLHVQTVLNVKQTARETQNPYAFNSLSTPSGRWFSRVVLSILPCRTLKQTL